MNSMNYIGLDIHKKSISCCVRQADGTIIQESTLTATRQALDEWLRRLPQPWMAGMEATLFTGWIYDHLVFGRGDGESSASGDAAGYRCRKKEE